MKKVVTGKGFSAPLLLIYILLLTIISWYAYHHPAYNPDMLIYMAIAKGVDKDNYHEVHREVYINARESLPDVSYNNLTDTLLSPMGHLYNDPDLFYQIIPAYAVKPLYILSIRFFEWLGINPVKSTIVPGIVSYMALSLLLIYWLQKFLSNGLALVTGLSIICIGPFLSTISLSTPDMMAAAFFFFSSYFLLERKQTGLSILLMVLSTYTRIEFVIPSVAFLIVLLFRKTISAQVFVAYTLLFILIFLSLFVVVRDFGWGPFYFIDYMEDYDENPKNLQISYNYFHTVGSAFLAGLRRTHLSVFMFIGLIPFLLAARKDWFKWSSDTMLIIVIFFVIALRIVLHPNVADRFFLAYYLILMILLVKNVTHHHMKEITFPHRFTYSGLCFAYSTCFFAN